MLRNGSREQERVGGVGARFPPTTLVSSGQFIARHPFIENWCIPGGDWLGTPAETPWIQFSGHAQKWEPIGARFPPKLWFPVAYPQKDIFSHRIRLFWAEMDQAHQTTPLRLNAVGMITCPCQSRNPSLQLGTRNLDVFLCFLSLVSSSRYHHYSFKGLGCWTRYTLKQIWQDRIRS